MTPDSLWQYIEQHRRAIGHLPKLRECVDHFNGKVLNVLMCLGELDNAKKDELRRMAKADRAERQRRQVERMA